MRYILFLSLFLTSFFARAESLPQHHNVLCGADFSCPADLLRRVDFWVDIFALHDNKTAVFHDRNVPERVYSVLRTEQACGGRRTPKAIKRERARISNLLKRVAKKKASGSPLQGEERSISRLFAGSPPSEIRKAAKRIRCQSGNATRFQKGVQRFGEHSANIASALKEFGLPDGVQYLPFVESAFNPEAYSRVGAAGLWQLMPATARHLGLEVNPVLDERMDPELATLAAIRYLQKSFATLALVAREIDPNVTQPEIFPFVITSYNYGVNGMRRAMREVGVNFINVLEKYKSESFQVAVKNFYASFLAARYVAINADKFFPNVTKNQPVTAVQFAISKPRLIKTIISNFGVPKRKLRELNPALAQGVWEGRHLVPRGYVLNLPKKPSGKWDGKIARLHNLAADKPPRKMQRYRVRKGNSACGIAKKFKVSCRKLMKENRLGRRGFIRVGQILTIPGGSIVLNKTIADARERIFGDAAFSTETIMNLSVETVRTPDRKYVVARGDTACEVAEKFGMLCDDLSDFNKLGKSRKLVVGQKLTIPGEEKRVVQSAPTESGAKPVAKPGPEAGDQIAIAQAQSNQVQTVKKSKTEAPPQAAEPESVRQDQKADNVATVPDKAGSDDEFVSMTAESPGDEGSDSTPMEVAQSFGSTDQYYVSSQEKGGKRFWTLRVQPDETLGHYADWLGGGFSSSIRRLNGLKKGRFVRLGQKLKLPLENDAKKKQFEDNRIAYHRALQAQFFEHFHIAGTDRYKMKKGDTGVEIAGKKKIPLWLLRRFNPEVFQRRYKPGETVLLPVIEER